jgi:hypothetical protein
MFAKNEWLKVQYIAFQWVKNNPIITKVETVVQKQEMLRQKRFKINSIYIKRDCRMRFLGLFFWPVWMRLDLNVNRLWF